MNPDDVATEGVQSAPIQEMDPNPFLSAAMPITAPLANPYVALRLKIAKETAAEQDKRREIDRLTTPYVERDFIRSQERQRDIQGSIEKALAALREPPPQMEQGFSDAEMWAGAIAGLAGGRNLPNLLNGLAQASGARNAREFEAKMNAYGLNRQAVVEGLRYLQSSLEDESRFERDMREANQSAQQKEFDRQSREDIAKMAMEGRITVSEAKELNHQLSEAYKVFYDVLQAPGNRQNARGRIQQITGKDPGEPGTGGLKAEDKQATIDWKKARTETENQLRGPKAEKIKAEIKGIAAREKLTDQQAALVLKKVLNYDDEFKARVANIYSQISKRASDASSGGVKNVEAELRKQQTDVGRLVNLNQTQLEALQAAQILAPSEDKAKRIEALEAEQAELRAQQEQIARALVGREKPAETTNKAKSFREKYKY